MTFTEAFDFMSRAGGPIGVAVFVVFVLLQLFSERVAKALGPILGAVGRWWHGREERSELELQRLLAARAATEGQRAGYQLADMEEQLRYFTEVVEKLRTENAQLRDELHTVHRLLDEARRDVGAIKRTIDTGERLAIIPPPPPPVAGRHHTNRHPPEPDETTRIRM